MKTRGRTASAHLAIVSPVQTIPRPDAPNELTDEQAEEWWAVINQMPADWFPRETHGMLVQYCRHVVAARRVAQLVAAAESAEVIDVGNYDCLLKMQEREGRALSSLATRMRISQQGSYDKTRKRTAQTAESPWDWKQPGRETKD